MKATACNNYGVLFALMSNVILAQVASLCTGIAGTEKRSRSNSQRYMVKEPLSSEWINNPDDEFDSIYDAAILQQHNADHDNNEISKCYRRDPDDVENVADEEGLRYLLGLRFNARKRNDFEKVDGIDVLLKREHGVRAYDNPNIWTRRSKPPASYLRRKARKRTETMKALFGPLGHPYRKVGGPIDPVTCPLTMTQVHSLLSKVQQYRMDGNFDEADATSFELTLNGVKISESFKVWWADGQQEIKDYESKNLSRWIPRPAPVYSEHSMSNRGDNVEHSTLLRVNQLMKMRSESLVRGEIDLCGFIEFELFKTYGVGIDEVSRTFFFGPPPAKDVDWQPPTMPADGKPKTSSSLLFPSLLYASEIAECTQTAYNYSAKSEPIVEDCVYDRIESLVVERKNKRDERKFYEADAILKELNATYSVKVDDESCEWVVNEAY